MVWKSAYLLSQCSLTIFLLTIILVAVYYTNTTKKHLKVRFLSLIWKLGGSKLSAPVIPFPIPFYKLWRIKVVVIVIIKLLLRDLNLMKLKREFEGSKFSGRNQDLTCPPLWRQGQKTLPFLSLSFKVCSIFWPRGLNPEDLSCRGMREDLSCLWKRWIQTSPVMDNRDVNQCGKSHHIHTHKGTHLHIGHSIAWTQGRPVPSRNIIWELIHLLFLLGCCLIAHNSVGTLIYLDIQLSNPSWNS